MNPQDKEILVCMKDGKYLAEESDGHATWNNWVDSPLNAKIFAPMIVYGEEARWSKESLRKPIQVPGYYQKWPDIPKGAAMVRVVVSTQVRVLDRGPEQP